MSLRIAIIAPIVVRYDAISTAVHNLWRMLSPEPGWNVSVLTAVNEYPDLPAHIVSDVAELLLTPSFRNADILQTVRKLA